MVTMFGCSNTQTNQSHYQSTQFNNGKFQNAKAFSPSSLKTMASILWRYISETRVDAAPTSPVPLLLMHKTQLLNDVGNGDSLYRLGHSSLLLALEGEFWLIDPVFSQRASPFQWLGPKRFHPTPIAIEGLPKVKGVIISHNHYDHLDYSTIIKLKDQVDLFVTPLGVGKQLVSWGVDANKVHELDWWQELAIGKVKLTATPAQHFSGRGVFDSNKTLWASWAITTPQSSLFFSGDSGYFDGFKHIGEKLGPFDLTILENGAYDRNWSQVHMTPEETMQAHIDLKGRALMPVHNGTFDLALHPWYEPLERLSVLASELKVPLVTPIVGERTVINKADASHFWWRLMSQGPKPPL